MARRLATLALLGACLLATATARAETLRVARYDTGGVTLPEEVVLRDALRDAGVTVIDVELPLGRSLAETSRGVIVDADPARTREAVAQFRDLVIVEEPVSVISFGAFTRQSAPPVQNWASLKGRRVVTFSGSLILNRLLRENGLDDAYRADTYTGAALMLAFGRAEVAVLPVEEAVAALGRYGITMIGPNGPPLASTPVYLVLNKRHAALAPRIAESLKRRKAQRSRP